MKELMVALIFSLAMLGWYLSMRENRDHRAMWQVQKVEQHCRHVGYAGRGPSRVYQCDDGMRLEGEVK